MLKLHAVSDSAPVIDAAEARWISGELASLLRQVDPESPAAHVLRHARRECESLVRSADDAASTVVGPFRVRAA